MYIQISIFKKKYVFYKRGKQPHQFASEKMQIVAQVHVIVIYFLFKEFQSFEHIINFEKKLNFTMYFF